MTTASRQVKLERRPGESLKSFLHREHIARKRLYASMTPPPPPPPPPQISRPKEMLCSEAPAPHGEPVPVVTKALIDAAQLNVRNGEPTFGLILRVCCHYFGCSKATLLADRRVRPIVRYRQIVAYLAKDMTLHSLPEIGRRLGGRDHTTILHGVRKTEQHIATGEQVAIKRGDEWVSIVIRDVVADLRAAIRAAMIEATVGEPGIVPSAEAILGTEQPTGEFDGASC